MERTKKRTWFADASLVRFIHEHGQPEQRDELGLMPLFIPCHECQLILISQGEFGARRQKMPGKMPSQTAILGFPAFQWLCGRWSV